MTDGGDIDRLRRIRDELRGELGAIGDFRPGAPVEFARKCGKPICHCARPGDPGRRRRTDRRAAAPTGSTRCRVYLLRPGSCPTAIATNWFQRVILRSLRPLWCRFARDSNSCLGTSLRNCSRAVLLWAIA